MLLWLELRGISQPTAHRTAMEQEGHDFNKMVEFAYRIAIKKDDTLKEVDELFCETFGSDWKAKILREATLSRFDFKSIKCLKSK